MLQLRSYSVKVYRTLIVNRNTYICSLSVEGSATSEAMENLGESGEIPISEISFPVAVASSWLGDLTNKKLYSRRGGIFLDCIDLAAGEGGGGGGGSSGTPGPVTSGRKRPLRGTRCPGPSEIASGFSTCARFGRNEATLGNALLDPRLRPIRARRSDARRVPRCVRAPANSNTGTGIFDAHASTRHVFYGRPQLRLRDSRFAEKASQIRIIVPRHGEQRHVDDGGEEGREEVSRASAR